MLASLPPVCLLWDGRIKKASTLQDECTVNIAAQYPQPVNVITESQNKTRQTLLCYLFQGASPNSTHPRA